METGQDRREGEVKRRWDMIQAESRLKLLINWRQSCIALKSWVAVKENMQISAM